MVGDNIVHRVESLLQAYDSCTSDVQCQAIRTQLDAIRVQQQSVAYTSGYPSPGDPSFACKIAGKREFAKNGYPDTSVPVDTNVCDSASFQLTPNQIFIKNFFDTYDNLLLFHGVGVGKTCSAITVAEACFERTKKPALVLLPPKLKSNFERQVYDVDRPGESQCTGRTYADKVPDKGVLSKSVLQRRVQRLIAERYEILSFGEFGSIVEGIVDRVKTSARYTPEDRDAKIGKSLLEYLNERLIIIDEVHNLKVGSEPTDKRVPPLLELALRHAHRCKLLLMTATPMYDDAAEIVWLINLLRLNAKQDPLVPGNMFSKQGTLTSSGRQRLADATRGCVSYMRGNNPWTFPTRLYPRVNRDPRVLSKHPPLDIVGQPIPADQKVSMCLVRSDMSSSQGHVYRQLLSRTRQEALDAGELSVDATTKGNSISSLMEAADIVFPDAGNLEIATRVGRRGLEACFDKSGMGYAYKPQVRQRYGEFLSEPYLAQYAPKLSTIVKYIQRSEGFVYVYSRFISSGLIPLALALEHAGYQRYNAPNLLASTKRTAPATVGPNKKHAKYAIISGEKLLSPHIEGDFRAMRSIDNRDGEIVKIILCSNVGTEGIDFKHVREIHILEPWYNLSRIEQIIGRGARQCSHYALPLPKRNVTIYNHVAIQPSAKTESIDYRAYRIAERKQRSIDSVERVLKENAVDCVLNRPVVYLDPVRLNYRMDIQTSQGVLVKGMVLGDAPDQKVDCNCTSVHDDKSTMDVQMLLDDTKPYQRVIASMYTTVPHHSYTSLLAGCKKGLGDAFDEQTLLVALQMMLSTRFQVLGPGGTTGFLQYLAGEYVLQPADRSGDQRLTIQERLEPRIVSSDFLRWSDRQLSEHEAQHGDGILAELQAVVQRHHGRDTSVRLRTILDYHVDRLPSHKLHAVLSNAARGQGNKRGDWELAVLDSLRRAHVLMGAWPTIDYFFDSHLRNFWRLLPSGDVAPASTQQTDTLMKGLRRMLRLPVHYDGFLDVDNGHMVFKMRNDGVNKGYVCVQTSTLTVGQLQSAIKAVNLPTKKGNKSRLCEQYELGLRTIGERRFARPFHHYWVSLSK